MQLADLMNTNVLSVGPDLALEEVANRMVANDTGAAAVVDEGKLVGVISERDLMRQLAAGWDGSLRVGDRMVRAVLTATPSTELPEAMAIMIDGHFRHLPIVSDDRVVGMVSMRDLMAWASMRLRGTGTDDDDGLDTAELVATINRFRTGAN